MPLSIKHCKRSWFIKPSNKDSKIKLRKHFRELRNQLSSTYRKNAATDAAAQFTRQEIFRQSENIACYLHYGNEFDSSQIIEAIWRANKNCYLPVVTEENSLRFVRYEKDDALQLNRYSILEPASVTQECVPENLDIVMVPLVAFDLQGHRLGAGGGYYDKTFAFLRDNPVKRPLIIGLGYSIQQAEELSFDEWDVGLDGVVTDKEFIVF